MGELMDKIKGKVKQTKGSIKGDRREQTEGYVEEKKGDVKGAFEDLKHDIKK